MESIYLKIIDTIQGNKALFKKKGLPAPVTVDLFCSQPDAPELYEFFTPAIFIDYSVEWEHGNKESKRGQILIDLHIVIDPLPSTANFSGRQTDGLKKVEYNNTVAQLIEGLRTDTVGTIVLTGEEPRPAYFYNYHVLHFCGSIKKDARPALTPLKAKPIIKVNE